jgi:hypothetical protein
MMRPFQDFGDEWKKAKVPGQRGVPGIGEIGYVEIEDLKYRRDGKEYPVILSERAIKSYLRIKNKKEWKESYLPEIKGNMRKALEAEPMGISEDGEMIHVSDGLEFYVILGVTRLIKTAK